MYRDKQFVYQAANTGKTADGDDGRCIYSFLSTVTSLEPKAEREKEIHLKTCFGSAAERMCKDRVFSLRVTERSRSYQDSVATFNLHQQLKLHNTLTE